MVFSSTIFLFIFLPATLLAYFLVGRRLQNSVLLLASLFFYAWGETFYVLLMGVSILFNYCFGLAIHQSGEDGVRKKVVLGGAVAGNLLLLGFFKYANFIVDTINPLLRTAHLETVQLQSVHLPIGISFFTFQAISYVVDVYRGEAEVQKRPLDLALYISMFPQLIAGPIVRYNHVAQAISARIVSLERITAGVQRFIIGLAKKVLIANVLGRTADYIFSIPGGELFCVLAWLGALSYTLQIYYDFSGYSDMAIGLGMIFGFSFPENFNYPYISRSIREFWKRWHISLSTWFRDYLYIPLGGSRVTPLKVYRNLFLVFFLCGLWHGANWTFVAWGGYHGLFLILERTAGGRKTLNRTPALFRHLYVMVVVVFGWVLFRAENIAQAASYMRAMLEPQRAEFFNSLLFLNLNTEFYTVFSLAVLGATPLPRLFIPYLKKVVPPSLSNPARGFLSIVYDTGYACFFTFILSYSIASIISGDYNPFLYFRF